MRVLMPEARARPSLGVWRGWPSALKIIALDEAHFAREIEEVRTRRLTGAMLEVELLSRGKVLFTVRRECLITPPLPSQGALTNRGPMGGHGVNVRAGDKHVALDVEPARVRRELLDGGGAKFGPDQVGDGLIIDWQHQRILS